MKLSLDLRTALQQTLTPQQIQYLKLLQLPTMQLEQHIAQEIEQNPMLDDDDSLDELFNDVGETEVNVTNKEAESSESEKEDSPESMIDDRAEPFEFHDVLWSDGSNYEPNKQSYQGDEFDNEEFQIKDNTTFIEDLISQLKMMNISKEELFIGEIIIGNIDDDGYLRRDLEDIVEETNKTIAEINYAAREAEEIDIDNGSIINPAKMFTLSDESSRTLLKIIADNPEIVPKIDNSKLPNGNNAQGISIMKVDMEIAEKALDLIRTLDPPGIGSKTVQECLIAQARSKLKPNAAQKLALEILEKAYEPFTKKHYNVILKKFGVTEDYLKEALAAIRRLNPKPGGGDQQSEMNTIIPDFMIEKDEDTNELLISLNDNRMPILKLNKTYERLKKEAAYKKFNKETREWIRNKYEDARFLIQAIKQRKTTMIKVMTAIAHLQKDFFYKGDSALKPLIYKNVAEETELDISTICRIVNGKYVQTDFGTKELKYFFSEAMPNLEGENISTKVIKQTLKKIIDTENKKKPLSDERLSKMLSEKGTPVARRTVAKYREQLKIPVARLRKEL